MATAQSWFFNESAHQKKNLQTLRVLAWLITICAGFVQAWASRFWISPDGNSYLDIASAYLHGDWSNAVNAYWSPLFSWLLALSFGVFRPSPFWESTAIHLLNLAGLLLSLRTFEFFFCAFLRLQAKWRSLGEPKETLAEIGWWILGYALFLSTSLLLLSVVNTTPDVWVAVFTYLVAGLILRIAANGGSVRLFIALGFVLGCAYLTKTVYFPLSFLFLLVAWLASRDLRKTLRQAALGFLAFALVAGSWVATLSRAKQRFTFGDVGRLTFVFFYDQLWQ